MDVEAFRKHGKDMVDYICDYVKNIETRNVAPTLDAGFLSPLLPDEAPQKAEKFEDIMDDFEKKVMPGVLHWNHPKFFAYFPAGNSFPSILGDMLSSAIGSIGFSWASCPSIAELEMVVLDWYAKALNLPKAFIRSTPGSRGGGALQGSASECTLICMITARARAIQMLTGRPICNDATPNTAIHDSIFLPQLIAYCSKEAHSSVEKAAKMALVKLRLIEADERCRMRVDLLKQTIQNDINAGLTPFFVVATSGTTGACAFDNLNEIGKVCQEVPSIWFHVDGAYGGNSFILPEMRHLAEGMEYADSFNTNPNKLLLTNFDASAMWVRDVMCLTSALNVDPLYLKHEYAGIDYRHYSIALSRRFRSLKLWFVFRTYGISGIQAYIRNHITLAKKFESLVRSDERFEVRNDVHLGLVCFRMRTKDQYNQELLAQLNHTGNIHMVPSMINGKYVIRFCVVYEHATEEQIVEAWREIKAAAETILSEIDELSLPPSHENMHGEVSKCGRPPIKHRLTRTKSQRFSFTRSISREVYESQGEHLRDGCTPILVIDQCALTQAFQKAIAKNNEINKITNGETRSQSNNNKTTQEGSSESIIEPK